MAAIARFVTARNKIRILFDVIRAYAISLFNSYSEFAVMKFRVIIALLASLVGTAYAAADELARPQTLSLGGAALTNIDSSHVTLWSSDAVSAGLSTANTGLGNFAFGDSGLQTGGFFAWQSSIYRIDATLNPSFDGQMSADFGASIGAQPGETGTRYGLRIGTAWMGADRYTTGPVSGFGLSELGVPNNNVNVVFLVNHALTPNLNLIGLAEAQHGFGISQFDGNGNSGLGRLIVGAGLGYKF